MTSINMGEINITLIIDVNKYSNYTEHIRIVPIIFLLHITVELSC